jgi:hypothetical protein
MKDAVYKWQCMQPENFFNPLNAELNPTCHLLALLEAHHILHISRIRVNEDSVHWWSAVTCIECS